MRNTRKLVLISVLISLSVVLGIIDKYISSFILPGAISARLGLANIVIMLGIIYLNFKDVLLIAILKSVLIGFILGRFDVFIYGFSGTMLSFFGMWMLYKFTKDWFSLIGISLIGAILHIIGQVTAVHWLLISDIGYFSLYFIVNPFLIPASMITGVMIGILTKSLIRYVDNSGIFKR
ncbi:Gx transporter family protein [Mycoplasmatota bacterium]|nr:Gx transporter family protein [Mycoplasmatota bacterium]